MRETNLLIPGPTPLPPHGRGAATEGACMLMTIWILIATLAIAALAWILWKRTSSDILELYTDRRRHSSRLVSRGEFVDGMRRLPVALALTDLAFYYENSDMQASLERQWIHEVEYDDELTTGQSVGSGTVLRLRCFSQKFEFLLAPAIVRQWRDALPPHRMSSQPIEAVAVTASEGA